MKYALLIAALVLLAVQTGTQAKNQTFTWQLGGKPGPYSTAEAPIILCPGDFAIFAWDEGIPHNVFNTTKTAAADICDKSIAIERVPTATKGTYTVDATKKGTGVFGILCTVGGHCTGGMNAVISILPNTDAKCK